MDSVRRAISRQETEQDETEQDETAELAELPARECGLDPPPRGRVGSVRSPWLAQGVAVVLHLIVLRGAELLGPGGGARERLAGADLVLAGLAPDDLALLRCDVAVGGAGLTRDRTLAWSRLTGQRHHTVASSARAVGEMVVPMSDEMRADVAAAWARVTNKVGKKRDVRKLPEYLNGGETVLAMAGGHVAGNNGLLVATDRRAMFVSEGIVHHRFEDFPYDRITTVTLSRGMVFGKIVISTSGLSHVVDHVDKSEAEAVAAVLRERVEATCRGRYAPPAPAPYRQHDANQQHPAPAHAAPSPGHAPPPGSVPPPGSGPTAPAGFSVAAELRELAELRDQGVLTPEEFEGQKARLLRR